MMVCLSPQQLALKDVVTIHPQIASSSPSSSCVAGVAVLLSLPPSFKLLGSGNCQTWSSIAASKQTDLVVPVLCNWPLYVLFVVSCGYETGSWIEWDMVQDLGFRVHKHVHWGLKTSREVVLGFFWSWMDLQKIWSFCPEIREFSRFWLNGIAWWLSSKNWCPTYNAKRCRRIEAFVSEFGTSHGFGWIELHDEWALRIDVPHFWCRAWTSLKWTQVDSNQNHLQFQCPWVWHQKLRRGTFRMHMGVEGQGRNGHCRGRTFNWRRRRNCCCSTAWGNPSKGNSAEGDSGSW